MNNINAVVGLMQMERLDRIISQHKKNSNFYDANILNDRVKLLRRPDNTESSSWIYSLLVDDVKSFKNHMEKNGVMCDPVHVRNDVYSVFSKFKDNNLPGVDEFTEHMINIPVGWWLSNQDRERIVSLVNEF